MLSLYRHCAAILSLVVITLLFRYQSAYTPETATDAIQHLSKENHKIGRKASTKAKYAPKGREPTGPELDKDDMLSKAGKHGFKEALKMITNLHHVPHLELANLDAKMASLTEERLSVNSYEHAVYRRSTCPNHKHKCPDTGKCIFYSYICDRDNDCDDGSDEMNCMDHVCPDGRAKCSDTGTCIRYDYVCDGVNHCNDGSDELNCMDHVCTDDRHKCSDTGICIPYSYICDGYNHCSDGSDEMNCTDRVCPEDYHKCSDTGKCIPYSYICDGDNDCNDGADEMNCPCPENMYRCDSGQCMANCPDTTCTSSTSFECETGICVDQDAKCNGTQECSNGRDETDCTDTPETAMDAIQHLSKDCELPVYCSEDPSAPHCCYDCTKCQDVLCANHWQCCTRTGWSEPGPCLDNAGRDRGKYVEMPAHDHTPECTRLFKRNNKMPGNIGPSSLTFMFTVCHVDAQKDVYDRCWNNFEGPVMDYMPVLGSSGYYYRNIHCMKCYWASSARGTFFNLALHRSPEHYFHPFLSLTIDSRDDFAQFDIDKQNTSDTLTIAPTPYFTNISDKLDPCSPSFPGEIWDFRECDNSDIAAAYSDACDKFKMGWKKHKGLSIHVIQNSTGQWYRAKNIACAYCALGDDMTVAVDGDDGKKHCRFEFLEEPWILMSPLLLTDDNGTRIGELDIGMFGPSNYQVGYVRHKVTPKTWLKILCPRHQFIYMGMCHPTFTYTAGQSYFTKVKVSVEQDDDEFYNEFGPAVVEAILHKSNLVPCHLKGTIEYSSTGNVEAVIFEIFFTAPTGTLHKDVLDMIKPIFRSDPLNFTFNDVVYSVRPADDVIYSNDEPGRLIHHNPDTTSELRPKTATGWRFTKTPNCQRMPIPLTRMEFCFRLHLQKADFMELLDTMPEDYKEQIDDDTVAVCIDKYDEDTPYKYTDKNYWDNNDICGGGKGYHGETTTTQPLETTPDMAVTTQEAETVRPLETTPDMAVTTQEAETVRPLVTTPDMAVTTQEAETVRPLVTTPEMAVTTQEVETVRPLVTTPDMAVTTQDAMPIQTTGDISSGANYQSMYAAMHLLSVIVLVLRYI